ncbi:Nucleoporin NSP1 [Grifola frondosa]|uniref:Nucleoporin NSP1 n=1 Tax=Grifola frondosa TaxID=5627 RepID=A0A1C7MHE5_GRIFR|nr:Nucleoporin NSP1 [Grifola frondosa]
MTVVFGLEDLQDISGKRRRSQLDTSRDDRDQDEGDRQLKRKRLGSPEVQLGQSRQQARPAQGYLDVPEALLPRQVAPRETQHGRSSSLALALSSQEPLRARRTLSPAPSAAFVQPMLRTHSMDPALSRALTRDASMQDVFTPMSRDVTMSPVRQIIPLRARTSVTPQPSSQMFGATVQRPLQQPAEQAVLTLGTIMEADRQSRSPQRQRSTLFLGPRPGSNVAGPSAPRGMRTTAEKALNDLDVFKTPLLPTRLRESSALPDIFKPKKVHMPVLMRKEREHKPQLGRADEDEASPVKPYAGRGGMKRLLARRRMEEEEEAEIEEAAAIEEDDEESYRRKRRDVKRRSKADDSAFKLPPPAPSTRVTGREQSSLRVGRTRTARNHIARPLLGPKNRFSAASDEDEADEQMIVGDESASKEKSVEEPLKKSSFFEGPAGFSFAKDTAPILHDSSNAREPPIAALPFSLSKSTAASSISPTKPTLSIEMVVDLEKITQPTATTGAALSIPAIVSSVPSLDASTALVPPAPTPAKISVTVEPSGASAPTANASSIPNFFANSSIFLKPGVTITPPEAAPSTSAVEDARKEGSIPVAAPGPSAPPIFSAQAPATAQPPSPPKASVTQSSIPTLTSLFGGTPGSGTLVSVFGGVAATSLLGSAPSTAAKEVTPAVSNFGAAAAPTTPASNAPAAVAPTAFPPAASVPAVATPAEAASAVTAPASSFPFPFGAPAKPAAPTAATSQQFGFGAPAKPAEPASSPFLFGAPKADLAKEQEIKPAATAETSKPSLFGAPLSSTNGAEVAKSTFSFGQPVAAPAATPAVEPPKPLFGASGTSSAFSFGQPTKQAQVPATKMPFSFGTGPATPTIEKPSFPFGSSASTGLASGMPFGAPSSGSNGADVSSKPFTFGAPSTLARQVTPPHQDQEVRMDESPTRGGAMDINGDEKQDSLKPSSGFSFGSAPGVSPFGQSNQSGSSPFGFGPKVEAKTDAKPTSVFGGGFGQGGSTGFNFGQKSVESTQSPLSPSPFGMPFGQPSTTPTTTAPAFPFGGGPSSTGFGHPSSTVSSAPASPSTFNAPFAFGATPTSATAPSNPFSFGSQPASPVTTNPVLPPPAGTSSVPFAFGQPSSVTAQSSAFGATTAPPTGGALFTMGAAPAPTTGPSGRAIKKLPTRSRKPPR